MRRSLAPSSLDDAPKKKASNVINKFIPQCRVPTDEMINNYSNGENRSYHDLISSILSKPFKIPSKVAYESDRRKSLGLRRSTYHIQSLHDPYADDALVLFEPPEISACEKLSVKKEDQLVHVVVDPILTKVLRPHQREGVRFMYDCVMGNKIENNYGCIMADEMGLGKTLQCITVMWTLMRQSPSGRPVIAKAVVACPASLVKNWSKEIQKWLFGRVPVVSIDGSGAGSTESQISSFVSSSNASGCVLVVSYETFRQHAQLISRGNVGLMICDEGHRLKNQDNQVYRALNSIPTTKRILISGTPIQNDLLEYFSLIQFVNTGLLGSASQFRKNFEIPILRGRDGLASDNEKKISEEKLNELVRIVNVCVIRRTSSILSQYLPVKVEQLICVKMTDYQLELYQSIIEHPSVARTLQLESEKGCQDDEILIEEEDDLEPVRPCQKSSAEVTPGGGSSSLQVITLLKKLCNHPELLMQHAEAEMSKDNPSKDDVLVSVMPLLLKKMQGNTQQNTSRFRSCVPATSSSRPFVPELSGKFKLLDCLLAMIRTRTNDKIVLISNYTQTLDLFEALCKMRRYSFTRLDGSVPIKKRQTLVDRFNSPDNELFIFMLSSKAGGCGLNLIGANRLVMFDPDWNPANDSQAMARVWREGQRKQVFVYRFLSLGSLEETMVQRQIQKQALSSCVVDEIINTERHFNRSELRNLFKLDLKPESLSSIHTNLRCSRCIGERQIQPPPEEATCNSSLSSWYHISSSCSKGLLDDMLKGVWQAGMTFVFYQTSHKQQLGMEKVKSVSESLDVENEES